MQCRYDSDYLHESAKRKRPDGTNVSSGLSFYPAASKTRFRKRAGMMTNQEAQPPSGRCNPGAFKCPRGERSSDVDGRRPDKSDYL